jgi:hypothetical protein
MMTHPLTEKIIVWFFEINKHAIQIATQRQYVMSSSYEMFHYLQYKNQDCIKLYVLLSLAIWLFITLLQYIFKTDKQKKHIIVDIYDVVTVLPPPKYSKLKMWATTN